jgi:ABC-2 type transport system permease protein
VKIGMFLLHRFVFVVLFIFFMTVNIGNIVVSYSTFFKNREVAFLITQPTSFAKIFLIKFLDNFFYSSSTLLLMVTAALSGYTSYIGLPWYFIPFAVLIIIFPFMFIAGMLGAITLLLIMRISARFGIRKVLIFLASIYATTIISFYIFSSPIQLVTNVFSYFPNLNGYFGFLEHPAIKLLPNHWVADALYWISSGKFIAAGWYLYLLIIVATLLLIFALFLAKNWFYKSWLVFLDLSNTLSNKKKSKVKTLFSFENKSSLAPTREALLKRELLLFFRDPTQWTHFLVMAFLIAIFILSISSVNVMIFNAYNIYLKTVVYLIIYLFNIFLIASMSLRFIFPLVSLEGETIWKIRSAPIDYKKLMFTRLFVYFLVIFMIGQILNFVSNFQFSFLFALISQMNTAFATITLVTLNFGMGSAYVNYKEKSPIRVASSQGASLTFLFTIIYLVFLIIILFAPLSNFFFAYDKNSLVSVSQLLFTSAMLGTIAFIIAYLSISKGLNYFLNDI